MLQTQLAVILAVKENRCLPRGLKTSVPDGSVCVLHLKHRNTKRFVVYRSARIKAPSYLHTGARRRTNMCTQREAWRDAPCCARQEPKQPCSSAETPSQNREPQRLSAKMRNAPATPCSNQKQHKATALQRHL